jgi:hypothetical protein
VDAAVVVTRSKTKKASESAREILMERQRKEAKFAKPKYVKPAAIIQEAEDMDYTIDADVDEVVEPEGDEGQGSVPI